MNWPRVTRKPGLISDSGSAAVTGYTCVEQHDIQYAYVIKVKICHETLMNRGREEAAALREGSRVAEGDVELF